jgi:hypothetical protein
MTYTIQFIEKQCDCYGDTDKHKHKHSKNKDKDMVGGCGKDTCEDYRGGGGFSVDHILSQQQEQEQHVVGGRVKENKFTNLVIPAGLCCIKTKQPPKFCHGDTPFCSAEEKADENEEGDSVVPDEIFDHLLKMVTVTTTTTNNRSCKCKKTKKIDIHKTGKTGKKTKRQRMK